MMEFLTIFQSNLEKAGNEKVAFKMPTSGGIKIKNSREHDVSSFFLFLQNYLFHYLGRTFGKQDSVL